jgi:hypothetical protein
MSIARSVILAVAASALLQCAACVSLPRRGDAGSWITADSSLYTPVARLRTRTEVRGTRLVVHLLEGTLTIPGTPIPGSPPLMSRLTLTAVLAVGDTSVESVDGGARSDQRSWRQLAVSEPTPAAIELRYGETVALEPRVFEITEPGGRRGAAPFVLFRLTGNAVEMRPPEVPGGAPIRRDWPGGVLVYACGDRDIFGARMPERAAGLRRAYGIAC